MPGINQMCSYDVVVFVSMLALVSGQCTKTYSGFKQCTNLNGATHKTCLSFGGCGMCSSPSYFREKFGCNIDSITDANYLAALEGKTIHNSTTCKTLFYAYMCPQMAINIGEGPCDASGAPMRICYDLCTAFNACFTMTTSLASADGFTLADLTAQTCKFYADANLSAAAVAAKGEVCFGTAGNKGMAAPSGATSLTVSSYITALASTVVAFVIVTVA